MIWSTEKFLRLLKDKLGEIKITSIFLSYIECSSVSLNEFLSVLYTNIAEDGLKSLHIMNFPKNCEIDSNLMQDIAQKAAPTLKNLKIL